MAENPVIPVSRENVRNLIVGWKTISMVMRYAHHHPESLRAGVEILDRVPAGVSTNLAQSVSHTSAKVGTETALSG